MSARALSDAEKGVRSAFDSGFYRWTLANCCAIHASNTQRVIDFYKGGELSASLMKACDFLRDPAHRQEGIREFFDEAQGDLRALASQLDSNPVYAQEWLAHVEEEALQGLLAITAPLVKFLADHVAQEK